MYLKRPASLDDTICMDAPKPDELMPAHEDALAVAQVDDILRLGRSDEPQL